MNRGQCSALTCRARQHCGWLSPRRRNEQRQDQCPHPFVPTNTLAGFAQAYQKNRGESSTHTCRARYNNGWLNPRRKKNSDKRSAHNCRAHHHSGLLCPGLPIYQRTERRPQKSCSPKQCLAVPTTNKRPEAEAAPSPVEPPPLWLPVPKTTKPTAAREATSPVLPATTVAGCAHADQANRGQRSALNFLACHHSRWLYSRRQRDQRPVQIPYLLFPPHSGCLSTRRTS